MVGMVYKSLTLSLSLSHDAWMIDSIVVIVAVSRNIGRVLLEEEEEEEEERGERRGREESEKKAQETYDEVRTT